MLSGLEVAKIFERFASVRIAEPEVRVIADFFKKKYQRSEINRKEFHDLMATDYYSFGWTHLKVGLCGTVQMSEEMRTAENREDRLDMGAAKDLYEELNKIIAPGARKKYTKEELKAKTKA